MIDVDLFKQINDTYGHAAGDLVLTKIADAFREDSRNVEPLSRVGGEEFAILFECDNEESACIAAERFRNNIEGLNITIDQQLNRCFNDMQGHFEPFSWCMPFALAIKNIKVQTRFRKKCM